MANKNSGKAVGGEKPKRLVPKPDVLRSLYLLSGNVCAFPRCANVLINSDGVMVADICHIEGVEGPRFNPAMSNEQRRSAANLVMLCKSHHATVDGNEAKYTVAKLKNVKQQHEAKFAEIDDRLQQGFVEQFLDQTEALAPTHPKTFAGLSDLHNTDASIPKVVKEVRKYVDKLSLVPDRERRFLLALIRRAARLGWKRRGPFFDGVTVSVSTEDIRSTFGIGDHKIKKLADAFERYEIGGLNEVGEGIWDVYADDPSDYVGWSDLVEFAEKHEFDLDRFVLHLEFDRLDQKQR